MNRRDVLLTTAAAGLCAALPARADAVRRIGGPAFGSTWRLTLPAEADADTAAAAIRAVVDTADALYSPYRRDSALSAFNRSRATGPRPAPVALAALTGRALDICARTGGAFDPTLGPVTGLFGFGPIRGTLAGRPDLLAAGDGVLGKDDARLTLDLCGIAKGHALDLAGAALDALGLRHALIEMGGEVLARGRHPEGRDWQVLAEPFDPAAPVVLAPRGRALATSGVLPQGFSSGGRSYSHLIEAARRAPAPGSVAAVTVLAGTAAEADALATALCALPADAAVALADALAVDALFTLADSTRGTPTLRRHPTGRIGRHLLS